MGLDMFAWSVAPEDALSPLKIKTDAERKEIHYWRKHHDLHGWMEHLWFEKLATTKGRKKKNLQFNCETLELTSADLDRLEKDIQDGKLPHTIGFFFGNNPPDDSSNKDDFEFIEKARKELEKGRKVYYDSWW